MNVPSRRLVAGFLAAAVVSCLLGSCSPQVGDAGSSAASRGTVRVGVLRGPTTFLDWERKTNVDQFAAHLVFRRLARPGTEPGRFVPDLAESWQELPDGRSILFRLREGFTWEDGRPVTSEDVVFSAREATATGSTAAPLPVEAVQARGPYEVVYRFRGPYPYMLRDAARGHVYPAHILRELSGEELASHPFHAQPVGSGPFRLEQRTGQYLSFAARDDSPAETPKAERVVLRILQSKAAALRALEGGEIDLLFRVPLEQVESLRGKGFRLHTFPTPTYFSMAWNARKAPWDRAEVRRAMTVSIDRQALATRFEGTADAVAQGPVPPDHAWYEPIDFPSAAPSPESASKLLASSGWRRSAEGRWLDSAGRPVRLRLLTLANALWRNVGTIVSDELRRAGVEAELVEVDFADYAARRDSGEFDALLQARHHLSGVDLAACFSAAGLDNFGGIRDAELEELLSRLSAASGMDEARDLFTQARRRIAALQPWSFLYYRGNTIALSPRLHGPGEYLLDPFAVADRWWIAAEEP